MEHFIRAHGVYISFWLAMGVGFLGGLYFVIRFAIVAAYMHIRTLELTGGFNAMR